MMDDSSSHPITSDASFVVSAEDRIGSNARGSSPGTSEDAHNNARILEGAAAPQIRCVSPIGSTQHPAYASSYTFGRGEISEHSHEMAIHRSRSLSSSPDRTDEGHWDYNNTGGAYNPHTTTGAPTIPTGTHKPTCHQQICAQSCFRRCNR